jgi:hypothetical protein
VARRKTSDIDNQKLDELIATLEQENKTKKWCCEYLGIPYNTKRLDKLVEERKEYLQFVKEQRRKKRGQPIGPEELRSMVEAYLEGEAVSTIADRFYRSAQKVKSTLELAKVPIRRPGSTYFEPELLPDETIREDLAGGIYVYSSRYGEVAKVKGLARETKRHGKVYAILLQKTNQHAYQPWYELSPLDHLGDLNLTFY